MRRLIVPFALSVSIFGLAPALAQEQTPPPLVLAVGGEPETGFDPIQGWGRYGNPLFQATLLKLDSNLNLVGDLATEWALSEDRLTWTVTLRQDAKFSDGTPLTAEDVVFTFNTARDAGGLADLKILREARAIAPDKVELELTKPQITFTAHLTALGIVPKSGYGADYARHPVGAGPFQMVEWREGEQLILAPNPYWHGGKIPFPRITLVFGDEATNLAMGRTGAAQVVSVPPSEADAAPQGMRLLHVDTVDNRGVMFPMVPAGQTTADGLPLGNDVTSDKAIRVAINQALDRDALVALAMNGHGAPARGPVDNLPWDNPEADIPGNNLDAARATLEAGGWIDTNGDGIREKDGREAQFDLIYFAGDSLRQALSLGVAEQVKPLGIAIKPAGKSREEVNVLKHSNAVLYGWGAHDPSEIYNLYHSSFAGVDSYNAGFYANSAVDAHFDAAQRAPDFEASLAEWKAAQWDGTTGFGSRGDAAWAWLINLDHSYWVSDCLDIGPVQIEPHGHGYPITQGLQSWKWTCP